MSSDDYYYDFQIFKVYLVCTMLTAFDDVPLNRKLGKFCRDADRAGVSHILYIFNRLNEETAERRAKTFVDERCKRMVADGKIPFYIKPRTRQPRVDR